MKETFFAIPFEIRAWTIGNLIALVVAWLVT